MSSSATAAAAAAAIPTYVLLQSSDGEVFKVEAAVLFMESQTLKNMMEDGFCDGFVPIPNVRGRILAKVIEFCRKRAEFAPRFGRDWVSHVCAETELRAWEKGFVQGVDRDTLWDLIRAASYLDIKSLMDLTCKTVADMLKGKRPEKIRTILNIENDLTPKEGKIVSQEVNNEKKNCSP